MGCCVEGDQLLTGASKHMDWVDAKQKFLHSTRLFDGNRKKHVPKRNNLRKKESALKKQQDEALQNDDMELYFKSGKLIEDINWEISRLEREDHKKMVANFFRTCKWKGKRRHGFFNCPYCGKDYDYWDIHEATCVPKTFIL